MKEIALAMTALLSTPAPAGEPAAIPTSFESSGADRQAILALLDSYTRAVSTKDQTLFETLLLNQAIPFSSVDAATASAGHEAGAQNYPAFRKAVFGGPAFTQRLKDVRISQDGALADVTLVFVNTRTDGESWGWKTLQLLICSMRSTTIAPRAASMRTRPIGCCSGARRC